MQVFPRPIEIARVWTLFAVLLLIAVLAFWPSYFAPGLFASANYIHLHAATASLWMILLIAQPWLIRTHRYEVHKKIGRLSLVIAPLVIASMILLANFRIRTVAEDAYALQTFILYLQFSLAGLFMASYILAIVYRRTTEVHARFMVCTGLTLIDPVFARIMFWLDPESLSYAQWLTFGLTDLVFVLLIWFERRNLRARWVFPLMLAVFILVQIPALFWLTEWPVWQMFAAWFKSIPLT